MLFAAVSLIIDAPLSLFRYYFSPFSLFHIAFHYAGFIAVITLIFSSPLRASMPTLFSRFERFAALAASPRHTTPLRFRFSFRLSDSIFATPVAFSADYGFSLAPLLFV
jgi:hypothetical protein